MRLILIFFVLAALVLIPFFIWGDTLMAMFSQEGAVAWIQQYGTWAWGVAILLLISDLFLPLPATIVMAALGYLYGPFWGGIIGGGGFFLSGMLAYVLCRSLGEKAALRILGEKDLAKGHRLFSNVGGWLVVLSRWLPVFPEVIACMAGLTRMPQRSFYLALACSSMPMGFVYAYVGHMGVENPTLAIVLSAAVPPILWLIIQPFFWAKARKPTS